MVDERARYERRVRRLRRACRRWSVLAGGLCGAAAVLTPYAGLGAADAVWAAAAGGAVMLAGWRWVDYRTLAAEPAPPPRDPALGAGRAARRIQAFVAALPGGQQAIGELRRHADRVRLNGSVVAPAWHRLDRAAAVLDGLGLQHAESAQAAVLEATEAEQRLRDLAKRAAAVERGLPYGGSHNLSAALNGLTTQLEHGVTAYEELVGAAAAYVAEDVQTTQEHTSLNRLTEATDLLRGIAQGFAELRRDNRPVADQYAG